MFKLRSLNKAKINRRNRAVEIAYFRLKHKYYALKLDHAIKRLSENSWG